MRPKSVRGLFATMLVVAACSPAPPSPTPPPSAAPSPTASFADTIRISMAASLMPVWINTPPTGVGPLSNANFQATRPYSDPGTLLRLVSDGLYKFDDQLAPIPDLTDGPCDLTPDGLTFTCHLLETSFHDGSPLTADDVAFTYGLALARTCSFEICDEGDRVPGIQQHLKSVEAVDRLTVRFHLVDKWAPFITSILPIVMIDSRKVVTQQFEAFMSKARTVPLADLDAMAKRAEEVSLGKAEPRCEQLLRATQATVRSIGLEPADPAIRTNACDLLGDLTGQLGRTIWALGLKRTEAIAAAYPLLPFNLRPTGTGPWKVSQAQPGKELVLEAFAGYHEGPPKTSRIVIDLSTPPSGEVSRSIATGGTDIQQLPEQFDSDTWKALKRNPDLHFVRYAMLGYLAIQFNLRPGHIFADPNLREALDRCIDKPDAVEAATRGLGVPINSDVAPSSWAYNNALSSRPRDPVAARRLIEQAGWRMGADDVYVRKGQRLASKLLVRSDFPDRTVFARIVASEARDCGIDITVSTESFFPDLRSMIMTWPHNEPGTKHPFDLYLGGWVIGVDPDDAEGGWASDRITSAQHPNDTNYIGFSDPEVDRLLLEGSTTYALANRATIYRRIQEILAAKRPYIFAYAFGGKTALAQGVGLASGRLDPASPFWNWRLTDLVLQR